jgi:hypothetical protein
VLKDVGASINYGLKQRCKDAHAVLQAIIRFDAFDDAIKCWKWRETNRNANLGANNKTYRCQFGLAVFNDFHCGGTEIQKIVIQDEATRSLDLAEGFFGRDTNLDHTFYHPLFFISRI